MPDLAIHPSHTKPTPPKTEDEVEALRAEIHRIYHNRNDGPRLLNELFAEFPYPRGPQDTFGKPMAHSIPSPE